MAIDPPARVAFLKKIHLFHGLSDEDLFTLADELEEMQYAKGNIIFKQDGKAEGFYLIYGGNVRITRKQNGRDLQLAVFVKNDYFGELALATNRKRSATATATADTSLLFLSRKNFDALYKRAPELRLNLDVAVRSRLLARKLRFKWLRPDEVIYFLARKHTIVLWQRLFLPSLALAIPAGLLYAWLYVAPLLSILWILATISFVVVAGYLTWLWIDWGNDYYIVTNQRVVWLEKVVGIYDSRQETPLNSILSVGVELNQVGKYLDYGHVNVRTFVGKIVFSDVDHPAQAGKMIEEYWNRTKEYSAMLEKDAMKNALRKQLGLPIPSVPRGFGEPAPQEKKADEAGRAMKTLAKMVGANNLKLRYEDGDSVVYRKHWIALIIEARYSILGMLACIGLLIGRLVILAFFSAEALFAFNSDLLLDTWIAAFLIALVPFLGWFLYRLADWSNDKFEVTNDQIIDIDRTPFGTEIRNSAQLENIIGTLYERKGLLGNIFNFGTVYITVGGNKLAFENVMDPATVQSDIDRRRMARTVKKKEGEAAAERDRIAQWLAAYHRAVPDLLHEQKKLDDDKKK